MLTATAEVAAERGAASMTVAQIVKRAGVSRRTFYEVFDDCEACFLAAFDESVAWVSEPVLRAYRSGGTWRERMRGSLSALLGCLDEDPFAGRLLVVESLAAGRKSLERRSSVLSRIVRAVEEGGAETKAPVDASTLTAEGVVGAVFSVIHARLLEDDRKPLAGLVNPLMSIVVLPYLGQAAGRKELGHSVDAPSTPSPVVARNPLKDLEMRLTYRTVRVLAAVASNAPCSNRVIGDAAGMSDQGQASKLLARLERLGLIENARNGAALGLSNAWTLTKRGEEVADVITAQATPA
jgi:AcrR family transcriptional regulator/DNA-binding MarR family transcriptional regulator